MQNTIEKKYKFFSDPGHGWMEVDRSELKQLGIENQISDYSYQKDDKVYLEEDCDAPLFLQKKFGSLDNHSDSVLDWHEIQGQSEIRGFKSYQP